MPAYPRALAQSRERAHALLQQLGRELRDARHNRDLSQRLVAIAAGISQAQVSMIERGRYPTVSIETLVRFAAAVGLELSIRLFPAGQPVRDRAHIQLLERFRAAISTVWTWAAEVPLPIPGDKRAWDRVIGLPGLRIGIEAETRPRDAQELGRRLALKRRDGGVDRMILILPNTAWCRQFITLNDLGKGFPVSSKAAIAALRAGRDPGGDAIVLI